VTADSKYVKGQEETEFTFVDCEKGKEGKNWESSSLREGV
jgi:hypothetical protein